MIYSKLFEGKEINKHDSNKIEGSLTMLEITNVLRRMKSNKTPGTDGFPADFYKVFWKNLKHFVLKALNESYDEGQLSITMRQSVVSCLPKGDKRRDHVKNWRPISLLNVTYKIGSGAIAARLKVVLNKLIAKTQTGFLSNRFIGESTRLVYHGI